MAASGASSPPPPPPSPPPLDSGAPPPPTPVQLFDLARLASSHVAHDFARFAKMMLPGRLPDEAPIRVRTEWLSALLLRTTLSRLRGATLTLPLGHAPVPLSVAIPTSASLRAATAGEAALVGAEEIVDVALISWGVDLHGWRLQRQGRHALALSNVSALSLRTARDDVPLELSSGSDARIHVRLPMSGDTWPFNRAMSAEEAGTEAAAHDGQRLA